MRICDLAEWRVVQVVHPRVVTAIESTLECLATENPSSSLRDAVEFLQYELDTLVFTIPAHRELNEDAISVFKTQIGKVFPTLSKLLTIDLCCFLEVAAKSAEHNDDPEWANSDLENMKVVPLVNEELCISVVSVLESFNKSMEAQFRARLRRSTPCVEQPQTTNSRFDSCHKVMAESLLGTLQGKLSQCPSRVRHEILLELAGREWQAAQTGPKFLYLSGCGSPRTWQEVEYVASHGVDKNHTDVRHRPLPNLCRTIIESMCYNKSLKVQITDQGLCKMDTPRGQSRQQRGVPSMSIGQLIEQQHFLPMSSTCPMSERFTIFEKRELTLDLSWCLIHLFNCKWTDDCWSVDKIFLLQSSEFSDVLLDGVPPYIQCKEAKTRQMENVADHANLLGESIYLKFGKLLVEIETGEKVAITEKDNHGNPSLWLTIEKLVNEGKMASATDSYLKAIEGSLDLHRGAYQLQLSETAEELNKLVYGSIVSHLEEDHSQYRKTSLKRQWSEPSQHQSRPSEEMAGSETPRIWTEQALSLLSYQKGQAVREGVVEQDSKSSTGQIITDGCVTKRARIRASSPPSSLLFENAKPCIRRSARIASKVTKCTQPAVLASSRTAMSKAKPNAAKKSKTSAARGKTEGFEIFDDIIEQVHDARTVAKSKAFFELFDVFIESYLPARPQYPQDLDSGRSSSRRVRICVIDTGLDMTHQGIRAGKMSQRLKEVKSWKNDLTDRYGHGTHAADLIFRIAPEAELYVAKIADGKLMPAGDEELIAQAIDWAVSRDVDIISMSFGIDKRNHAVDEAISRAVVAGKILLAAAGNHGNNGPRAFPGTNRHVICVHASDGKGKDGKISPQAADNDDNFMTLGIAVPLTWKEKDIFVSGTSFATPIAAGIAADVLEIAKEIPMTPQQDVRLYSCEGMRRIFQLLSRTSDNGYKYLAPWGLWKHGRTEGMIKESILEKLAY